MVYQGTEEEEPSYLLTLMTASCNKPFAAFARHWWSLLLLFSLLLSYCRRRFCSFVLHRVAVAVVVVVAGETPVLSS